MKTRFRVGKEGMFGKPVMILQVHEKYPEGPDDYNGLPTYPAGERWRDAKVEDMQRILEYLK